MKAPAVPSVKQKKVFREARLKVPPTSAIRGPWRKTSGGIVNLKATVATRRPQPLEEWGGRKQSKRKGLAHEAVKMSLPVAVRRSPVALVRGNAQTTSALVLQTKREVMVARFKTLETSILLHSVVSLVGRGIWRSSALILKSESAPSEARRAQNSEYGFNISETLSSSSEQQNWVRVGTSGEAGLEETSLLKTSEEQDSSFPAEGESQTQTQSRASNASNGGETLTGAQGVVEETREAIESAEKTKPGDVPSRAQLSGSELGQMWREVVTPSSEDDSEFTLGVEDGGP